MIHMALPPRISLDTSHLLAPRYTPYQRDVKFVTFRTHSDSVDERLCGEYLLSQARSGREARLSQQPRHQPYHLLPVSFLKPAVISGQWPNTRIILCI